MSPDSHRYRLFEAVAEFLALVAAQRPVLLILEDLHWADKPSLLLLRHILRAQRPAAICIVGSTGRRNWTVTRPWPRCFRNFGESRQ